jgi:beta-lactamase superfamily II metal-dependent hydrolase
MKCEIELLPVGDASKAGDAIVIRYGDEASYELMLVDGGHAATGELIVEHVRRQYGEHARIKHVVLTHCDLDHACGLRTVFEELEVENFWLNAPWAAAEGALRYFEGPITALSLREKLVKEFDQIADLVNLALARGVAVHSAFAGTQIGPFVVLGPHEAIYNWLLPQFERTPAPNREAIEADGLWIGERSFFARIGQSVVSALQKFFDESWTVERLKDGGITSASNETSIIMYADLGEQGRALLTGDAGINALSFAAGMAKHLGLPMQQFKFVQIPHHGSRSNVGPKILNELFGPILPEGSPQRFSAYVSAPKDDSQHPRQMVLNAFTRRGGGVVATQGQSKVWWGGWAPRPGYISVTAQPLVARVEDYD